MNNKSAAIISQIAFTILLTGTCRAQELEIFPPARGGSGVIENPDKIREVDGVITGNTPQDAANAAVGKFTGAAGTGIARINVGSGVAYVSTAEAAYQQPANQNAARANRLTATANAFTRAQIQLGEFLEGSEVEGQRIIDEYADIIDTEERSLLNSKSSFEQKLKIATEAYTAAYVLYDTTYTNDNAARVSIIVTPKTIRGLASHTSSKVTAKQARNAADALRAVNNEVQTLVSNNILFAVGSKQIYIPKTDEFAFMGFGTEVIRTEKSWPDLQKKRQKIYAVETALANAKIGLVEAIKGSTVRSNFTADDKLNDEYKEFERDRTGTVVFDQARAQLAADDATRLSNQVIVQGQLPPGTETKSYYFDDNNDGIDDIAFSIVAYSPSLAAEASVLRGDIKRALTPMSEQQPKRRNKPAGALPSGKPTKNSEL